MINSSVILACDCDSEGAMSQNCDKVEGYCDCKPNVVGHNCDNCIHAYYGFPNCRPCNCDERGSKDETCENGVCSCATKTIVGEKCDLCAEEHFDFPNCQPCKCSSEGSLDQACNVKSGDCDCKPNVVGRACDECLFGYFGFPDCISTYRQEKNDSSRRFYKIAF